MCEAIWREREKRSATGTETSTLVKTKRLDRNQYYMSSIIDILAFLATHQLPLRGTLDAFDSMGEGGSGLFLSLYQYTLQKYPQLARVVKTIPRNATYTSHDIQNELIEAMSSVVTDAIVSDISTQWLVELVIPLAVRTFPLFTLYLRRVRR